MSKGEENLYKIDAKKKPEKDMEQGNKRDPKGRQRRAGSAPFRCALGRRGGEREARSEKVRPKSDFWRGVF